VVIFHFAQERTMTFPHALMTEPEIWSPVLTVTGVLDQVMPPGQQFQLAMFHGPAFCPSFQPNTGWMITVPFEGMRPGKKNKVWSLLDSGICGTGHVAEMPL
jgi:hypothetical protein